MDYEQILAKIKEIARGSGAILMRYFDNGEFHEATKATDADIVTDADLASDKYIREQFQLHFPDFGVITEEGESIPPKVRGKDELWLCADPLDGTTNFSCNLPIFSVSIGCLDVNYEPVVGVVYDPNRDEMFSAIKGHGAFIESSFASNCRKKQIYARRNESLLKCLVVTGFNPSHLTSADNNLREITKILPNVRCVRRLGSACLDFCYVAAARLDCYWEKGPHIWDVAAGWIIAQEAGCTVSHFNGKPFTKETLLLPMIDLIVASPVIHQKMAELITEARKDLPQ